MFLEEIAYSCPERVKSYIGIIAFDKFRQKNHTQDDKFKADIYSFGSVCFYLLERQNPYGGDLKQIIDDLKDNNIPEWTQATSKSLRNDAALTASMKSMVEGCWCTDASQRPNSTVVTKIIRSMVDASAPIKKGAAAKRQPKKVKGRITALKEHAGKESSA